MTIILRFRPIAMKTQTERWVGSLHRRSELDGELHNKDLPHLRSSLVRWIDLTSICRSHSLYVHRKSIGRLHNSDTSIDIFR